MTKDCISIIVFDKRGKCVNHFSKDIKEDDLYYYEDDYKYCVGYNNENYEYMKHSVSVFKYIECVGSTDSDKMLCIGWD